MVYLLLMDALPFDLDEVWRPWLAVGFAVLFYVLALVLLRVVLKRLALKTRVVFHLTLLCMGTLGVAWVFFPDKKWTTEVAAALSVFGAISVWVIFDRVFFTLFLARRKKVKVPNILRQILATVVLLVTIALVLTYGYGVKITGLLATSGVAAVILGFAMQDLLSNVIAGFSIHMTKAFQVGDWLLLDGGQERAEVKEVNWRATRLTNTDSVSFELPNSELVKSRIINLNYPTREHGVRLQIGIDYDQPPNDVKQAFIHAMTGAQGVLESPTPQVFLIDFGDSSIVYEMRFWMRLPHLYNRTCDEIRTRLWYELQRRDIRIPFPIRTLEMRTPNEPKRLTEADDNAVAILRDHTCMHCLSEEQAESLTVNASRRLFAHGEVMMREGDEGDSMQVILDGEADVFLKYPKESGRSGSEKVASLGKGDYFGEMSLMTGEPRSATVRARGDVLIMEIEKSQMAPILEESPNLLEALGISLARRQEEIAALQVKSIQSETDEMEEKKVVSSARLLGKIKSFFGH